MFARDRLDGVEPLLDRYAPSQVGIALALHGCPLESKGQETGARESTALYYAMQERLIERFPLMTPAWMNHPVPGKWTTPDVDQAAKNLITLGARAIVFVPIGFVTENHETQLDIGYTIDKIHRKEIVGAARISERSTVSVGRMRFSDAQRWSTDASVDGVHYGFKGEDQSTRSD